jgi:hypothetical protein
MGEERILLHVKSVEVGQVLTLEVQYPFHHVVLHRICEVV